jgi:hypothetical protein
VTSFWWVKQTSRSLLFTEAKMADGMVVQLKVGKVTAVFALYPDPIYVVPNGNSAVPELS